MTGLWLEAGPVAVKLSTDCSNSRRQQYSDISVLSSGTTWQTLFEEHRQLVAAVKPSTDCSNKTSGTTLSQHSTFKACDTSFEAALALVLATGIGGEAQHRLHQQYKAATQQKDGRAVQ